MQLKEEDMRLWEDNCKEKTCDCPWDRVDKCSDCPQQIFRDSTTIDKDWVKWMNRKYKRNTKVIQDVCPKANVPQRTSTTSNNCTPQTPFIPVEDGPKWPQVSLRSGYRSLNPLVMDTITVCQAKYGTSDTCTEGFAIEIANRLFGQQWQECEDNPMSSSTRRKCPRSLRPRSLRFQDTSEANNSLPPVLDREIDIEKEQEA